MKKLSKKQILMLHTQLIQQTGGSERVCYQLYSVNLRLNQTAFPDIIR